jgi:hypothetical protein
MTTDAILESLRNRRPFKITLADGRSLDVPHPEFVMLSPSGRILYLAKENYRVETLDVLLITGLEQQRPLSA